MDSFFFFHFGWLLQNMCWKGLCCTVSHPEPDDSEGLLICKYIGLLTRVATGSEVSDIEGVKESGRV